MCGCSANFNGDERDIITQDELNREFDFTGNRPSIIDFGNEETFDFTGNRPSVIDIADGANFDFTGNRPSVIDIADGQHFDFFGKRQVKKDLRAQGLSRKEARKVAKGKIENPLLKTKSADAPNVEIDPETGLPKATYGQGDWFSRNWIWVVLGVALAGGGYYIYKKRK